ncbi:PREDICTED: EF-hand calcium-binding domain-containing protein 11 isoform X4 [Crocodylus porosus]|uniref:EF-hand calcium-binding domain-containing protein 11 isoform X4 n=1 Tax=Crocodylus porosus TaxID=8502 RepID=UPI00093EA6EE|nr:PREDICTED: EF-hand calcium-binding domain-containing protein 11 isoform X4 [Crocodylus porosus]
MCAASARAGDRERYARVFAACDEDSKGYLSREDFKVAVVMLFGYKPSKVEVDSVMASLQQKNSGRGFLTLEDFKKAFDAVTPKLPKRIIIEAFREVDQDSDGHVSFKEFESAMNYGQDEVSPLHFA